MRSRPAGCGPGARLPAAARPGLAGRIAASAAGIRAALPHAAIAVDKWHLVKRTGCGRPAMANYERRVLTQIALTRAA